MTAITMRTAGGVASTPFSLVVDHNQRMDARGHGAKRFTEVEPVVRTRTLEALVEPHRDAVGLFEEPHATRMTERIKNVRETGNPGIGKKTGSGFLDDWLVERTKRPPTPSGDPS
ncbi:hypothetical protein HMPREF3086_01540 [Dietzia sp. HMSC21D01]|uniref:Uncharacterized protein n=1 Tax=Dietzia cinnamea TaxID=321318 RepID=A0AAW5Q5J0_9ACTN|nr:MULTISPECIES: hypothetical protein [Dietzia]MCT1862811.1 hypothetical protein [Dietzia cinnamea]MCT2028565.1 hypothetical protein [Dietzia cinnamea]MCT2032088.1 hypothetical protein [Dietzia cinnamea]MCT2075008.1 hypothetical protein [Dietzia cinnamea]MCT2104949.1 hypothetical protein [Dietzia cinnamea]